MLTRWQDLLSFHFLNTDKCKYTKMFGNGTAKDSLIQLQQVRTLEMANIVKRRGIQCSHANFSSPKESALALLQRTMQKMTYIISRFVKVQALWGEFERQTSVCCWESSGGIVTSSKWPSSPLSQSLIMTSDSTSQHADTSEQEAVDAYTDMGVFSTVGASKFL